MFVSEVLECIFLFYRQYIENECFFLYHYIHNESIGNYTHVPCVVFGKPSAGYCVYFISFSVILSIVAWRACLITIKCNEYVHIIVDKRIVALYSPTGKALRTFNFSDIVDVRVVNLPQVMYAASIPYVRKQQYICIQSDSSHAETRPHTTYSEIRSNPHCIVLAYNEYAYNSISSILLRQETGDTV